MIDQNEADKASQNRLRVKEGYCNEFYDHQKHMCYGWEIGTPPPLGLILGELPYASGVDIGRNNQTEPEN